MTSFLAGLVHRVDAPPSMDKKKIHAALASLAFPPVCFPTPLLAVERVSFSTLREFVYAGAKHSDRVPRFSQEFIVFQEEIPLKPKEFFKGMGDQKPLYEGSVFRAVHVIRLCESFLERFGKSVDENFHRGIRRIAQSIYIFFRRRR